MTDTPWHDADRMVELYRRLRRDDPVAPAEFVVATLDPLVAYLRAACPSADDHARITAAEDAILSVIRNPGVFDPDRGDLSAYLRMAAKGDLHNLLVRERRHRTGRVGQKPVELADEAGNTPREEPGDDLDLSFDHPALAPVIAELSAAERAVLDLMRVGERKTEAFAAVLGIGHLPVEGQRAEVYRVKERVFKRLRRAAGGGR